jgi:hypothetical protein
MLKGYVSRNFKNRAYITDMTGNTVVSPASLLLNMVQNEVLPPKLV